jgi:hypothetical protein
VILCQNHPAISGDVVQTLGSHTAAGTVEREDHGDQAGAAAVGETKTPCRIRRARFQFNLTRVSTGAFIDTE